MTITIELDQAIAVLNRMLEEDREAVSTFFEIRVPVNDALQDDPTVQVLSLFSKGMMGPLGVINGLFGIRSDGYGHITMDVDEQTGIVDRFYRTDSYRPKE